MEQHQIPVAPIARLLSIVGAASYLGVSPRMVQKLIGAGRLSTVKVGRRILLDRAVLDRFIKSETREAKR